MYRLYSKERRKHRDKFYKSKAWRKLARYRKKAQPFCVDCEKEGIITLATQTDHIDPCWRGGTEFIRAKTQNLCHFHHNLKTHFSDLPAMRRAEKTAMEFWNG